VAALSAIRDAIKSTIDANIPDVEVYDTVPDAVSVPAVVVMPSAADFQQAMGRGHDQWDFDLYVLASRAVVDEGQDALDSYVTGAGSNSIRQAIFQNRTLGLADVNAHVSGMSQYGGRFESAGVEHIGAVLRLVVLTDGRE